MFILKPIMFVSQVQILHAIFSASIKKLDKWTKICLMGVDLKSWARSSILERRFWDHEEDEKLKIHFSSLWNCNSVARYWNRSQKKEIFRKEEKKESFSNNSSYPEFADGQRTAWPRPTMLWLFYHKCEVSL